MALRSLVRFSALTFVCSFVMAATVAVNAIAAQPDHVHVTVGIVVPPGEASGAGDALGLYALQLLPCAGSTQSSMQTGVLELLRTGALVVGERALGLLVGVAHANHRERFDGPAAAEFGKRIALDRAATMNVGTLVAPIAQMATYCKVGLVLARLPSKGKEPALPFSLRLSKSPERELVIDFRENIEIPLVKPWTPSGSIAKLTVTLRPQRALQVLDLQGIEDGERMQRAVVSLTAEASASIGTR